MHDDFAYVSAVELARRIRAREVSPVEVVTSLLARIDAINPKLNAFVHLFRDEALIKAQVAEQALSSGRAVGPLHGVPVAIKDLFDYKAGAPNTFGCKPCAGFVPDVSATYVHALENAGAIILGKTNTPEFGHKGITDNLLWGPTSTPFDLTRNAGGSSGGSAAAVAAGLVPLAQGSDAGGSIRIPAAWCGVYGYKASYGRVAAAYRPDGFLSHTPFIHAGPLARSVNDAALMLNVMARHDPRDPLSLPDSGLDYLQEAQRSIKGWKIAYSPDLDVFPVDHNVARVVETALDGFRQAGATVETVKLGLKRSQSELSALWNRQMSVLYAEVAEIFKRAGLDLTCEHRNALPQEFIDLIEGGRRISALDYKLDDIIRSEVVDCFQDVFDRCDLLVTPTLASSPVRNASDGRTLGPATVNGIAVDPCIGWCLTYPLNFGGNPAASIPAGLDEQGLPVGLQIIGRRHDDSTVLAASRAFEQFRPWAASYLKVANLQKG
jgi:Asp-tRNA(Asn)/Glu-tRNA(Gln) amidotransferase A subunit family amidase